MPDEIIEKRICNEITASFPKRVFSYVIDQLVIAVIFLAYSYATGVDYFSSLEALQNNLAGASQSVVLLNLAYFTLLEGSFGQSIGKRALGIAVYDEDGHKPGYARALLRRIGLVTPLFNVLDVLAILPTDKNQRIFDMIASTLVLEEDKKEKALDFLRTGTVPEEASEEEGEQVLPSGPADTVERNIEGLREMKKELDERLENDEIDKDEYLGLKRKYDARIEELRGKREKSE